MAEKTKCEMILMSMSAKASMARWPLLIFALLFLPLCACVTENPEVDAKGALDSAVGEEESSLESNIAFSPVAGGTGEMADAQSLVTQPGQEFAAQAENSGHFTDPRDGQQYRTVKIGNLVWMGKNLNFKIDNSWCYNNDESRCKQYGRLYDWNTARVACPAGWRLPNRTEWDNLIKAAGGRYVAGAKLTSKTQIHGTDDFSFSALFGGYCAGTGYLDTNDNCYSVGESSRWWSATESGNRTAYYRSVGYITRTGYITNVVEDVVGRGVRFSVRCIQNGAMEMDVPSLTLQSDQKVTALIEEEVPRLWIECSSDKAVQAKYDIMQENACKFPTNSYNRPISLVLYEYLQKNEPGKEKKLIERFNEWYLKTSEKLHTIKEDERKEYLNTASIEYIKPITEEIEGKFTNACEYARYLFTHARYMFGFFNTYQTKIQDILYSFPIRGASCMEFYALPVGEKNTLKNSTILTLDDSTNLYFKGCIDSFRQLTYKNKLYYLLLSGFDKVEHPEANGVLYRLEDDRLNLKSMCSIM